MIRVRRAAIIFAVGSAIYWQIVTWFIGLINPLAGIDEVPLWLVALANVGSAALYAVMTLIFCRWFARSVMRQMTNSITDGPIA